MDVDCVPLTPSQVRRRLVLPHGATSQLERKQSANSRRIRENQNRRKRYNQEEEEEDFILAM